MSSIKTYKAKGLVYGYLWGGGEGAYPSKTLVGDSIEEVVEQADKGVDDKSLDGGMGFQHLLGALLNITETETIEIDGKEYSREEYHTISVGDLTEEQIEFLYGIY